MCGRYVSAMARTDLMAEFDAVRVDGPVDPASVLKPHCGHAEQPVWRRFLPARV
jgi:hypothetical protein